MNTLMMDTSSRNMLVALNASGELYIGEKFNTPKHLETLMPAVDNLLKQKNFNVANIDYLGVIVGPGSFTGIRIAVSTAKAMMMVNRNIKAIAVNALELMARSYYNKTGYNEKIAVVVPTTIKKVYLATFDNKKRITEDSIVEVEQLDNIVKDIKIISPSENFGEQFIVSEEDLDRYVQNEINNKNFCDKLSPCYIGLSQAEEQLKLKESK